MNNLCEHSFFSDGSVVWNIESTDKFEAIREVVYRSQVFRRIPQLDIEDFAAKVIEREKVQSTGFGHGVAVAHGRTADVSVPLVALGVSNNGLEFGSMDGRPVQLLFVVANHPDSEMDYLKVLSCLVGLVRNELFRHELLSCASRTELENKLCSSFMSLLAKNYRQETEGNEQCSPEDACRSGFETHQTLERRLG
ncbi:MAG: PTS sugar transporter subunit IIA [Spirochaetaceae bacterium]|nr:MAG: PTS sugar transporter subunit IIA [Spirochaetaceae bacterium]